MLLGVQHALPQMCYTTTTTCVEMAIRLKYEIERAKHLVSQPAKSIDRRPVNHVERTVVPERAVMWKMAENRKNLTPTK
jgi:hypothetical protein